MANLDSVLKSRDISLPTKVHIVKAMVFPVVMYGCESWTIKKAAAAAKSLQSCPTLSEPLDCSLPGSSVHGSFQARVLEWDAMQWLPFPPLGDLPNLRIKPKSPVSPTLAGRFLTTSTAWETQIHR